MIDISMSLTPNEFTVLSVIVVFAAIMQMSVGMGFGMLASPLIALVRPDIVPGVVMIIGLAVAVSGAWRERGNIAGNELKAGLSGRVVGSTAAFMILLFISDLAVFMIVFGITMLTAVLIAASGLKLVFNIRNLFGLSILSGLVGTITAVGAPPMAILYHQRPANVVRPTLNAFFAFGSSLGLLSLWFSGWLDGTDFVAALALAPAMLIGIIASKWFRNLPTRLFSALLLSTSAIASLLLVLRGIGVFG